MLTRLTLICACLLGGVSPLLGQPPPTDGPDLLVVRLTQILNAADRAAFPALFSGVDDADIQRVAADLFLPDAVRTTLRVRDRAPLEGAPVGDGAQLVIEVFTATPGRGRLLTMGLDVRRPSGGDTGSWRIVRTEGLSSLRGLYRLRLDTGTQYAARDFQVTAEDLRLTLSEGTVFYVECDDGITGLVLLGRGAMEFAPAPAAERGQLRIFSGGETLATDFESAFVRLNPGDLGARATLDALVAGKPDQERLDRAREVFARASPRSFAVDLRDLSSDTWHLLPARTDFVAEVRTSDYDTLTYSRAGLQAEDIMLFQRDARRVIALYPSVAKVAARGRFYSEDALRDYDVLDYNVDVAIVPDREQIEGRARLSIRARASISTVLLRLAEPLTVSSVTSVELGPLLFLRVQGQNTIMVSLPTLLVQDTDLTLFVRYRGQLPSQPLQTESLQLQGSFGGAGLEPHYLLSSRSYWYPQNAVSDYATASMRLTVPEGYAVVASGQPVPEDRAVTLQEPLAVANGRTFHFRTEQPLRYLALVAGQFTPVGEKTITINGSPGPETSGGRIRIAVLTGSGRQTHGRELLEQTEDIMRFYAGLIGDAPYPSTTVVLVDSELPGGHSPGFFAVLNDPPPLASRTWRNDPAAFDGFPEFFLAHELAHQWWGQAVGWKNYHEQWISEGFAQYFAALYAEHVRGAETLDDMIEQFRRWSRSESDQGPVNLGYRLGHIEQDPRVFRALVYNKGAAVLHMLRRLLGDEVFFGGLRRFYRDRLFQKAGTGDLQQAFEAESGRDLERFFTQWIGGTELPLVTYRTTIGEDAVTIRFEQMSDAPFDIPVTVSLTYADGKTVDRVVVLAQAVEERTIPAAGEVREVRINQDSASLAEFDEQ